MNPWEIRFWEKVALQGSEDGCWIWTSAIDMGGYGRFSLDGQNRSAHRIAFSLFGGVVPEGLELDHLCRVRHCVNPAHLEPVTRRENVLRGIAPAAFYAKRTHCDQGHRFSGRNLIMEGNARRCRACKLARQRVYDARRRGQVAA